MNAMSLWLIGSITSTFCDALPSPPDYYRTPEKVIPLHSSFLQPGISAQMVYRESPELKAFHFVVEYPRNNLYIPI